MVQPPPISASTMVSQEPESSPFVACARDRSSGWSDGGFPGPLKMLLAGISNRRAGYKVGSVARSGFASSQASPYRGRR